MPQTSCYWWLTAFATSCGCACLRVVGATRVDGRFCGDQPAAIMAPLHGASTRQTDGRGRRSPAAGFPGLTVSEGPSGLEHRILGHGATRGAHDRERHGSRRRIAHCQWEGPGGEEWTFRWRAGSGSDRRLRADPQRSPSRSRCQDRESMCARCSRCRLILRTSALLASM